MKKYYEAETGVLLKPGDDEYDSYKMDGVYDGEHSFYDENQFAFEEGELNKWKESCKAYVEKGVKNTYAIIKGPFELDDDIDIEDIEEFDYDIENVIWSIYKNDEGEIVENFLNSKNESLDEGKVVQTKKQLDDDVYVEYSLDDKKYYLASDYDRYIWTNFDSIEDAESFYKYHKNDVRNSILEKLEEPIKEDANKKPLTYEICYTDSRGNKVTGQYGNASWVGEHLKNLEDWGATDITVKIYKEPKTEEKLTEAPDDDNILTDDDLDAEEQKERDEMEARFKARRDKVAQQRTERDAKVARQNELKAKASELVGKIGDDWSFEHLFDTLVPDSGKCDTLAGEIVRAINKIEYRWFNDGDRFNEDYGIETCGQPAYFLADYIYEDEDEAPFRDIILNVDTDGDDLAYERLIDELKDKASDFLKAHTDLLATETSDMYDVNSRDVENWLEDENLIPKYDVDCSIPNELQEHLDKGNISERDLIWEVESWIENIGGARYSDVSVDWGNVYVNECNRQVYNELDEGRTLYKWLEEYAEELTNEYGDPTDYDDEEEEAEEEPEEEGEN